MVMAAMVVVVGLSLRVAAGTAGSLAVAGTAGSLAVAAETVA